METRRELVEAAGPNIRNQNQLMDSLAKKVEREDGRGHMEVRRVHFLNFSFAAWIECNV